MSFITYYISHSFKNAIKKLFKSWVAVFIAGMLLFAVLGGLFGFFIGNAIDNSTDADNETVAFEEVPAETEEVNEYGFTEEGQRLAYDIVESVLFTVSLAVSLIFIYNSDKSATKIFKMGDVNFLFPAPIKPQTVLLFRLIMQVSVVFLSSLYLLFQMPNIMKLGFTVPEFLVLFAGWLIMIFYGRMFSVLVYTVTSTKTTLRKYILPGVITVVALLIAAVLGYSKFIAVPVYIGALKLLSSHALRYFPVFGWIKGFVMAFREGDYVSTAVFFALIVGGILCLVYIIWKIKADFYEDALAGAEEAEERLRLSKEGKTKRKKERKKHYESYAFLKSSGSKVFFDRVMFTRKRFAFLGFFTKTSVTYLFSGVLISLLFRAVLEFYGEFYPFAVIGVLFAFFLFFRNLKNPISEETTLNFIFLVPESNISKVFWSVLSGVTCCALDLLPGIVVSAVILKVDIILPLAFLLLLITLEAWTSVTGVFIDMVMPSSVHKAIAGMFAMWLRMFAVVPGFLVLVLSFTLKSTPLVFAAAGLNILFTVPLFFAAASVLRKTTNE